MIIQLNCHRCPRQDTWNLAASIPDESLNIMDSSQLMHESRGKIFAKWCKHKERAGSFFV